MRAVKHVTSSNVAMAAFLLVFTAAKLCLSPPSTGSEEHSRARFYVPLCAAGMPSRLLPSPVVLASVGRTVKREISLGSFGPARLNVSFEISYGRSHFEHSCLRQSLEKNQRVRWPRSFV